MEVGGDEYFKSYEDLSIHELMLQDRPRNEAYRQAILKNKELFKVSEIQTCAITWARIKKGIFTIIAITFLFVHQSI
jgi:hypothetical protein